MTDEAVVEEVDFLGKKVVDYVTGFVGTATAHVRYLNGESQYLVSAIGKNNGMCEAWLTGSRIKLAESAKPARKPRPKKSTKATNKPMAEVVKEADANKARGRGRPKKGAVESN